MLNGFTFSQTLAAVPGLAPAGLAAFVEADLILPAPSAQRPIFCPADLARLELLCELAGNFDLEGDGLALVIGLIDQLQDTRRHLHAMAQAMQVEPLELRHRVGARFVAILADGRRD